MREVIVAKSAGFCFGVKRAVSACYEQAEKGEAPIYTFGPIIHNEQVVEDLRQKGIQVIRDEAQLAEITEGTVIIRSHGVQKRIYDQIHAQGLTLVDATCPFVRKIHKAVQEKTREGYRVIVIGNPDHPEVQGICGWAEGPIEVIETAEQAERLLEEDNRSLPLGKNHKEGLCIVSQTTFNFTKFNKLVDILKNMRYDSHVILNTICNATEERQTEARQLAKSADAMIVIGGRHSSNTQKLYEICDKECNNTIYIQTLEDLDIRRLPSSGCLGITAGASTPNNLIEEVSKQCQK